MACRRRGDQLEPRLTDSPVLSARTILLSRGVSRGTYAVRRAEVLQPGYSSKVSARLTGPMRKYVKTWKKQLSGCLEYNPKPIEAKVQIGLDGQGRLSRIKADTTQTAPDIVQCLAGAIIDVSGPPNLEGGFEVYRFH